MGWEIPFIRRREPEYTDANAPVTRLFGNEARDGEMIGLPEPVRQSSFDQWPAIGGAHPAAQLFTTFAAWAGFDSNLGPDGFTGRPFQAAPNAAYPYGELGVDPPRRVLIRPSSRESE